MEYYSVDRRGVYIEGKQIILEPNIDPKGNFVVAHINERYPNGFSKHGIQYFRDPSSDQSDGFRRSGFIELLLEATRKAHYPDKPSRYQSMFAWGTLDEALQFRAQKPEDPIYKITAMGQVHRGDMTLLNISDSFACIDHRMHLYWQSETLHHVGYETVWELVLELPVKIGEKII